MANKDRVFVTLYARPAISNNPSIRAQYEHAAYHWAIFVQPKGSQGLGSAYDVKFTDTYSNIPGSGGWQYQYRETANLLNTHSCLGQILIGKLPPEITSNHVHQILRRIPIPLEEAEPLQNCVTWVALGISELQRNGCAENFDVGVFMDDALASADRWLAQNQMLTGPIIKENYTNRKFP
jgi:hypothetical protein